MSTDTATFWHKMAELFEQTADAARSSANHLHDHERWDQRNFGSHRYVALVRRAQELKREEARLYTALAAEADQLAEQAESERET